MRQLQLAAVIEREGDGYVALCPEVDIASQGGSVDEARANLREAVELFFESADATEVKQRLHEDLRIERLEVTVAWAPPDVGARGLRNSGEAHGFVFIRQRGSHGVMQRRAGEVTITAVVPDPRGTPRRHTFVGHPAVPAAAAIV